MGAGGRARVQLPPCLPNARRGARRGAGKRTAPKTPRKLGILYIFVNLGIMEIVNRESPLTTAERG